MTTVAGKADVRDSLDPAEIRTSYASFAARCESLRP